MQIDDATMHAATLKCDDDAPKQAQEAREAEKKTDDCV